MPQNHCTMDELTTQNFGSFEEKIDRWCLDTNSCVADFQLKADELCRRGIQISKNLNDVTCLTNILNAYELAQNYIEYTLSMESNCLQMLHNKVVELEYLEQINGEATPTDPLRTRSYEAALKIQTLIQNNMDILEELIFERNESIKYLSTQPVEDDINWLLKTELERLLWLEQKIIQLNSELTQVDNLYNCFGRNCGCFTIPNGW